MYPCETKEFTQPSSFVQHFPIIFVLADYKPVYLSFHVLLFRLLLLLLSISASSWHLLRRPSSLFLLPSLLLFISYTFCIFLAQLPIFTSHFCCSSYTLSTFRHPCSFCFLSPSSSAFRLPPLLLYPSLLLFVSQFFRFLSLISAFHLLLLLFTSHVCFSSLTSSAFYFSLLLLVSSPTSSVFFSPNF